MGVPRPLYFLPLMRATIEGSHPHVPAWIASVLRPRPPSPPSDKLFPADPYRAPPLRARHIATSLPRQRDTRQGGVFRPVVAAQGNAFSPMPGHVIRMYRSPSFYPSLTFFPSLSIRPAGGNPLGSWPVFDRWFAPRGAQRGVGKQGGDSQTS